MIRQLSFTLFVEGVTDERFLSYLVQRVARNLIEQHGRFAMEIPEILNVVTKKDYRYKHIESEKEKILLVSQNFKNHDALLLHFDADSSTRFKAMKEHFEPARILVMDSVNAGEQLCPHLVPVIPVRNIEAWILSDTQTLLAELDTDFTATDLGLPTTPKQLEASDYKSKPDEILEKINRNRTQRRKRNIAKVTLYENLGKNVRLVELEKIPSYKQFVDDLTLTFKELGLVD